MNGSSDINGLLEALSKVLIRCFIIGILLMLFWACLFMVGADFAYGIHSKWFDISRQQFHLICYGGMGIVKIIILTFFLLPYISIRMVLAKGKSGA